MEINFNGMKCPKCGEKRLEKIELNLCYCLVCGRKYAYVDNEFLIEKRINGCLDYVAIRKSPTKSQFSHRNLPTKSNRLSFGFY